MVQNPPSSSLTTLRFGNAILYYLNRTGNIVHVLVSSVFTFYQTHVDNPYHYGQSDL